MSTPTREQDHCPAHSDYRADCNPCFDKWLANAEVRTQGYEAICDDIDQVLMGLSPFAAAWASAPETQRRYTERDLGKYWFEQGFKAGIRQTNDDFQQVIRLKTERDG